MKSSMIDKKIDEKESEDIKKIYSHYVDEIKEILKKSQFTVEVTFGDIKNKGKTFQDQIIKLKIFETK